MLQDPKVSQEHNLQDLRLLHTALYDVFHAWRSEIVVILTAFVLFSLLSSALVSCKSLSSLASACNLYKQNVTSSLSSPKQHFTKLVTIFGLTHSLLLFGHLLFCFFSSLLFCLSFVPRGCLTSSCCHWIVNIVQLQVKKRL